MHRRHTRLLVALVSLPLLGGCASRIGPPIAPPEPDGAGISGSASDEIEGHPHHDHAGHDHSGHAHPTSPPTRFGAAESLRGVHGHLADHDHGFGHGHGHAPRRLLRTQLWQGWCAPAEHVHVSACGTPFVHGLLTEPAFLGRDLFVDVTRSDAETEVEVELEWSLTKRLGLIAELPYIDADETGFGDAALGLRALLIEERRFLLSASTEVEIPTGNEARGLGSGALALGSSLHTWIDLGSWVTLQTVTGIEHVPDEDETELKWGLALAKSFRAFPVFRSSSGHGHDHGPTTFNLIAEIQGTTALSDDAGHTEGRWLLGASYPLTRKLDLRGAFSRSFGDDENEEAWTLGFIFHF